MTPAPAPCAIDALRAPGDDTDLRRLFGHFPTGVTALCAMDGDRPVGMTASAFVAISIAPPLVSVCIRHGSATWAQLRTLGRIGISFLGHAQAATARQLARPGDDRFAGIAYDVTPDGALFLGDATAWLDCSVEREIVAGDHDIILLRLHRAATAGGIAPLVFHASGFHTLTPID
ncbi:hypothetical protein ASG37_16860 [Sphingomonas sp. Leaf407]|uniref:flavin reductase family protein n=1 Tax=unclassified Sphingomonas TaxID=196159 RepID=UPI0006FA6E5E|nr:MULTISPECIES: flavin reductase family protein [unclassified Sphingomonas]KQN39862.1 hypothetical protein ASE97_16850 [Sphingomonas sp. Leaf42]KQT23648.1 hypothetical protein ASG37_16860 [Sphingomonas sp. Leaf407]